MGKHEIQLAPPAPTAKAVRAYRQTIEIERDALRAGAVELALASAKGDIDAKAALAALPAKLAALQFEIDLNHQAHELAYSQDVAAEVAWRAAIQTMEPEQLIEGISRELCCARCLPGTPGGCVITASAPYAGSTCGHPVKERHLFHLDDKGKPIFPYRDNPKASRIFDAALDKLKVRREFA